jgi:hypothetical protein
MARKLSASEEHARKLISANQIYKTLQHQSMVGIHGVPAQFKKGAPDPYRKGEKLPADYRYYRVDDPDSPAGRRSIDFLQTMGYVPATDGEYFPSMPGGKIFKCHPIQNMEAQRALKMIKEQEFQRAAKAERARLQEAARFAFGSGDITAEVETRDVDPRNL